MGEKERREMEEIGRKGEATPATSNARKTTKWNECKTEYSHVICSIGANVYNK